MLKKILYVRMCLISKSCMIVLVSLLSYGCASQNFVSSEGFEVYVSEKRYLNESCNNLRAMAREFDKNPRIATRKHLGLEPFRYDIASQHESEMIETNGRFIGVALSKNCH